MHRYNEEEQKEINALIESGAYFDEVRRWYNVKYHSPISERVFFIVITTMTAIVTLLAVRSFTAIFPIAPLEPVIYFVPDIENKVARLTELSEATDDPNAVIQKFLITEYVKDREGYSGERLERNVRAIHQSSSPEEYQRYRSWLDPSNPNSPITLYERHTERDVDVRNVTIRIGKGAEADGFGMYQAIVPFVATVRRGGNDQLSHWKAEVTFRYKKLVVDQTTGHVTPMEYRVVGYKVEKAAASGR